ncbi:MAG: heme-binding protein [Candidatus Nomurabacteria bacterium]|nr:heme-binding protein [Candidatus Nomurabacteria bacterium]
MKTILIILVVLILWSIWGYFGSRVEQSDYTVIEKKKDYEIRNYPAHIVAETAILSSTYSNAMNSGFSIVAGYIFGGNTKKEKIAMTAPVVEKSGSSEKISMTAPVIVNTEGDTHVISFGMPRSYSSIETLPIPNDSRVKLREVSAQKMAVLRFSWSRSESRVKKMKEKLLNYLIRDKVEIISTPSYAGYNAPWTPPWMVRNEILVEIK